MARKYRMVHDELLTRWLMRNFPVGSYIINPRLGAVSESVLKKLPFEMRNFAQNYMLTADAIAFHNGKVYIIECIVRPAEWWKIQQLKTYKEAFRVTERFKKYWDWDIELILLTTQTNPFMESVAYKEGIRVVKFSTTQSEMYLKTIPKYRATPQGTGLKPPEVPKPSSP